MELILSLLKEGATFPRWNGDSVPVKPRHLGNLYLPSGRILAVDPVHWGADLDDLPFRFSVLPGRYPVTAFLFHLAGYDHVGLVCIRFSERSMYRWEMGTRNGEELEGLKEGEFFGFGVDGGKATYLSPEAAKVLTQSGEQFDVLWDEMNRPVGGEVTIEKDVGLNAIYFETGGGDGFYPSYVSFDESDHVALLVTDFGLIDAEIDWNKV